MRRLRNALIGACLLSFVVLLGSFNATKPRILVLHSASQDSAWAQQMDRGMRQVLQANRRPISVEWLYLGAGSPMSERTTEEAKAEARRGIDRVDPDVLIAVDDEANSLVAQDFVGRERRILYVSLDRSPNDYGYTGAPNASGISEQLPWNAIRDAVIELVPGRNPRLTVIGVDNPTGRAELDQARLFDWGPVHISDASLVSTAQQWRDFVLNDHDSDILLVLSTQSLPDANGVVTATEIASWTQRNAHSLPIGTQVDFVTDGGALSFSPSPDDYGEEAIRLALDWLDNRTSPGPPPPMVSPHFEVAVRQGLLAQRGFALSPIYLEAARENGTLLD